MMSQFVPFASGILSIATIVLLIIAIKISYAIERVTNPRSPGSLPRYTNIVGTTLGLGVRQDDLETRAKVRQLRLLLLIIAALMALMALLVFYIPRS